MQTPWSIYHFNHHPLKIIQGNMHFRVSADAFLLADFVKINRHTKQILELGTGTGIIPLLLSTRTAATITAVEIQKNMIELASINFSINHLDSQITALCHDINTLHTVLPHHNYSCIVMNPPFFEFSKTETQNKQSETQCLSKSELALTFDALVCQVKRLLKSNGTFSFIHRPEYLNAIVATLQRYNFSLSRMKLIYTSRKNSAKFLCIEAVLKPANVIIEAPMFLDHSHIFTRVADFKTLSEAENHLIHADLALEINAKNLE